MGTPWLVLLMPCSVKLVRVGNLVFILIQRKNFQLFTVQYHVSCGLAIFYLYYDEVYYLGMKFLKVFIIN